MKSQCIAWLLNLLARFSSNLSAEAAMQIQFQQVGCPFLY